MVREGGCVVSWAGVAALSYHRMCWKIRVGVVLQVSLITFRAKPGTLPPERDPEAARVMQARYFQLSTLGPTEKRLFVGISGT